MRNILFILMLLGVWLPSFAEGSQIQLFLNSGQIGSGERVYNYAPTPDWPPLDYIDENGEFKGILSDIVRMIERQHGLNLNWIAYPDWSSAYEDLKTGKLHFSAGLHQTEERSAFMRFTEPFMTIPTVVMVRKDGPVSRSTDLNNVHIAAVRNYASTDYLRQTYPDAQISEFDTELMALISTSFGSTDAVVLDIVNASHLVQTYGFPNMVIGPEIGFVWKMRFGVHKDYPELFELLSEVVSNLDISRQNSELEVFINTYLPTEYSYWVRFQRHVLAGVLLIVLLIFGLTYANHRLKRMVIEKVSEIEESNKRYELATTATFDGIMDINLSKKTNRFEGAIYDLLGYSESDTITPEMIQNWHEIIDPHDRDNVVSRLQETIATGEKGVKCTFRVLRLDKSSRWVELNLVILRDDAGNPVRLVGAIRDIHERVRYLTAVESQNKQLREIAWMQSHEIRGPLCRLSAIITLIQDPDSTDVAIAGYLGLIEEAIADIDAVIHRVIEKSAILDIETDSAQA